LPTSKPGHVCLLLHHCTARMKTLLLLHPHPPSCCLQELLGNSQLGICFLNNSMQGCWERAAAAPRSQLLYLRFQIPAPAPELHSVAVLQLTLLCFCLFFFFFFFFSPLETTFGDRKQEKQGSFCDCHGCGKIRSQDVPETQSQAQKPGHSPDFL